MEKRIGIALLGLLFPIFAFGMADQINDMCSTHIETNEHQQRINVFQIACHNEKNTINYPLNIRLMSYEAPVPMIPLHALVSHNSFLNRVLREQCVAQLLKQGANPMLADKDGNTMLHLAAREGWCEIAYLLEGNQNLPNMINTKNKREQTPLHLASTQEMAEWLIKHGADVNQGDSAGKTPLHEAASHNRPLIVEALLLRDAQREAPDKKGDSPLAIAVQTNAIAVTSFLLEHGANLHATNNANETPLQHALGQNNTMMIKQFYAQPDLTLSAADRDHAHSEEQKQLLTTFDAAQQPTFQHFRQSLETYDRNCIRSTHIKSFCKKAYLAMQGIGALTTGIWTAARLHSSNNSNAKMLGYSLLAALAGGLASRICTTFVDWTIGKIRTKQETKALSLVQTNLSIMKQAIGAQEALTVLRNMNELPQTRATCHSQKAKTALANCFMPPLSSPKAGKKVTI